MPSLPPLPGLLSEQLDPLRLLCQRYGVQRLDVFGSAARGLFDPTSSDLDFIVQRQGEREPGYARRFCRFAEELEALYQRPVDLLTERMIRNPFFKAEVQRSRRPLLEI
ncbi:MAG: nucleotidyltransferase family protein [Synechococcus lacustris]